MPTTNLIHRRTKHDCAGGTKEIIGALKLYNTLTRQLEDVTSDDGVFRMYVCGVTPYDTTHLGHAFTYTSFDVLARYLEYLGFETITVQNVTDIDDDIIRESKKRDIPWHQLAMRETQKYLEDTAVLNIRPPDHFPYATLEVEMIQQMVANLLASGKAYERNGSVYYDVRADGTFGKLVDWDYDQMLQTANERGNFPDDVNKKDPLDFVLWQAAKSGEPTWDSPWGAGRPGWHIECSAMSMRYLGNQVDIHSGGADLIFPHHECEIAQSESYSGETPFVRYWFHIAMVRLEGEKMSKSLGNMIFVRNLVKEFSGDAIRYYLLTHKYRDPWEADDAYERLPEVEAIISWWREVLFLPSGSGPIFDSAPYQQRFRNAMDEDLDTPRALVVLAEFVTALEEAKDQGRNIQAGIEAFRQLASDVLGLRLGNATP